jgi:hypothetical protein
MAEPDAAHPSPYRLSVRKIPRDPFAEGMREMERATAPLRAIHKAVELATEPLRKSAEATQMAMEAGGFGRDLRQLFGEVVLAPRATVAKPAPAFGPNGPIGPDSRHPATAPSAPDPATAHPPLALNASPEAMDFLVERVAEAVVRRLAAPPTPEPVTHATQVKGRRGRRRREISVGGPDAALEAAAEEDPSVRTLAARALADRVPYSRRTIEQCDTYKAWRRDLAALRHEAAADGMADVLDAGLVRIRKRKPGRGREVDPTIDPAVEKMTREFLRLHGEEGLDGQ